MNYSSFIVKIIKIPIQPVFNKTNCLIEVIVEIYNNEKKSIISSRPIIVLSIWGKLGEDFLHYYKINDYLIVEGSLGFSNSFLDSKKTKKKVKLSVYTIYPFILDIESNP